MAKPILTNLDFNKNSILNAVIQVLASAPSSPATGQIYFDSVLGAIREYDGSAWTNKATDSLLLQGHNSAYHLDRTNHTGTQTASTISDLATVVQAYRLDQFAAPTSDVSANSHKITNLAPPTASGDATNKAYVDATVQGLQQKPTAQVATAAALAANTYSNGTSGVGATLTGNSNGALTVDGYAVLLSDLVLVKNEATASHNGLYVQTQLGDGSHPYILTRHIDMDTAAEFGGSFVAVENNGSTTANTLWLSNVAASITVGTTSVSFTQLNSATSVTAGNGISISGGVVTAVAASGGGLAVVSGGIELDTTVAVSKYAVAIGDGSSTSITVTHSLGTRDVIVRVYTATSTYDEVECDILHATTSTVTLGFAAPPTTNQYRCVVHA